VRSYGREVRQTTEKKEQAMYVVVQHTLVDPPTASVRGERLIRGDGAPDGTTVLQFYPARDGSAATCLWESNAVADVQQYVDDTLGDAADNRCYEVDAPNAFARQPLAIAEQPTTLAR
jgi:hypothetical protein